MTEEFLSAEVAPDKWIVFTKTANLDDVDPEKLKTWNITHKAVRIPSILQTMGLMASEPGTRIFELEYPLRFGQAHILSVAGPTEKYTCDAPDAAFIEELPTAILNAFVNRVDNSRGATMEELESLKKPTTPDGTDSSGDEN